MSLHHHNHSFSTSITNLLTGCSRYWRAVSVVPDSPSMSFTLLRNPFFTSICCNYICHWLGDPFLLTLKCCKSLFSASTPKLIGDALHPCLQCLWEKLSSAVKATGGGITFLDFKVNRFISLSGIILLTSLNKSVVKGYGFTIPLTSFSKVLYDSSFRLVSWVFNKEDNMVLALLVCFSHTPPMMLAEGGFCFHSQLFPFSTIFPSWNHWSYVGLFLRELIGPFLQCKSLLKFKRSYNKVNALSGLRSVMFPLCLWSTKSS